MLSLVSEISVLGQDNEVSFNKYKSENKSTITIIYMCVFVCMCVGVVEDEGGVCV